MKAFLFLTLGALLCSCVANSPEKNERASANDIGARSDRNIFIPFDVSLMPDYNLPIESVTCELDEIYPTNFSETCMSRLIENSTEYKNFQFFEVNFPLWTDGSDKKRWLYLPADKKINTSDPDNWIYPVGTILAKEFSYDGTKVETRILEKLASFGANNWKAAVYVWNADQAEATVNYSGSNNVLGTGHDVPSSKTCINCHKGREDYAMGPEGVQLEHRGRSGLNLDKMKLMGLQTHQLPRPFIIKANQKAQKALGYLHGNCSHCHNPRGQWPSTVLGDPSTFNFRHMSTSTHIRDENSYRTLLDYDKIDLINPDNSSIILRMKSSSFPMPPVGVKVVDQAGIKGLLDWIETL